MSFFRLTVLPKSFFKKGKKIGYALCQICLDKNEKRIQKRRHNLVKTMCAAVNALEILLKSAKLSTFGENCCS